MKKTLFLFFIALGALSCIGSEGPRGPQGPQGPKGEDGVTGKEIRDFNISASKWTKVVDSSSGKFLYYQALFTEFEELDDFIYNDAVILAYLEENDGGYLLQKPLPYTQVNEDSRGNLWQKNISYDFGYQSIAFNVTNSDFREDHPGPMTIRLIFIW